MKRYIPLFMLLFLACGKKEEVLYKGERGGTLVVALMEEPSNLNPLYPPFGVQSPVVEKLFSSLHMVGPDGKVRPALAESWEYSEDLRSITYYLRRDAKWWDGKPVTAEDIVFTYNLIKDPKNNSPLYGIVKYIEKVEALDEHRVRFTFTHVFADELLCSNIFPLPEHIWKKETNIKESFLNYEPTGSGPYRLDVWKQGERIELVANKNFWGGRPPLDRICFWFPKAIDAVIEEMKDENVHLIPDFPPIEVEKIKNIKNYTLLVQPGNSYLYIGWNLKKYPFSLKKVREALTMAIDRKGMIEKLLHGYGEVARGPIVPASWAYDPDVPVIPYDKKKAREVLKGYRKHTINLIVEKGDPLKVAVAREVKRAFEDVGMRVRLEELETPEFVKRLFARKFDGFILSWKMGRRLDPSPVWSSDGIYNFIGYRNKEVDKLIEEGVLSLDRKRGKKIWSEFQRIVAQDVPYSFLIVPNNITVVHKSVKGIEKEDRRRPIEFVDALWIPAGERKEIDLASLGKKWEEMQLAMAKRKKKPVRVSAPPRVTAERALETALLTRTVKKKPAPPPAEKKEEKKEEVKKEEKKEEAPPPPPPEPVIREEPKLKKFVVPEYPEAARLVGAEGRVYVRVTVGVDGKVTNVEVVKDFGNPACTQAAIEAAKKLEFEPGKINGVPTPMSQVIFYEFPPR